ncbi:hypothetical protein [Lolliginicoccus suaedae]|uniref:hypothetical protein n=1 Tax=Lolliginicoccus suaedae TaxID=2605429 RepID=UPI0016597C0A|nr:hypothetical protein [Lolliginicoccus suaedae]
MRTDALRAQVDRWSCLGARAAPRARGERLFHPRGECFTGQFRPSADAPVELEASACHVRLSKGLGLGGSLPDALGISVRFLEPRPWDVLLISIASAGPLGRLVPVPAVSWTGPAFSTLMPYRSPGSGLAWFHARAANDRRIPCRRGALSAAVAERPLELVLGSGGTDGYRAIGSLLLTMPVNAQWSFDPVLHDRAGWSLALAWLATMRAGAYRGSRSARGAAVTGR